MMEYFNEVMTAARNLLTMIIDPLPSTSLAGAGGWFVEP